MDRDRLVRECFALNSRIGFRDFHAKFFTDPDAVRQWPHPTTRDRELKAFWEELAEERFADFRGRLAGFGEDELLTYRSQLLSDLARSASPGDRPAELARASANDNRGGRKR